MAMCTSCGWSFGHKPGCPEDDSFRKLPDLLSPKNYLKDDLPPLPDYKLPIKEFTPLEPPRPGLGDLLGFRYEEQRPYDIPKHYMPEPLPFGPAPTIPAIPTEQHHFIEPPQGIVQNHLGVDTGIRFQDGGLIRNDQGALLGRVENNLLFNDYGHRVGSVNDSGQILDINGIPTGDKIIK